MASNGINTELSHFLGGVEVDRPEEEIGIQAHFNDDDVQAAITTSQFTFVNAEARTLKDLFDAREFYRGLKYKIEARNNTGTLDVFDGHLDMTTLIDTFDFNGRMSASIIKKDGLNKLDQQLSAVTFALLEDKGIFTNSDYTELNYIVERKLNIFDELVAAVILLMMIKEFRESIRNTANDIAEVTALIAGGFPATGQIAAVALGIVKALISIAYTTIMLIAIVDLGKQLLETLLPPVRTHKTLKLKTSMEKICSFLGYGFQTDITDLDEWYYLPSNPQLNESKLLDFLTTNKGTPTGLPNASDFGYQCNQWFEMVKALTNSKFALKDGVVFMYNKHSDEWKKQSNWIKKNPLEKTTTSNASELIATKLFEFQTDISDEWTVDNSTGFRYEVRVDDPGATLDAKLLKRYETINFNLALGTRREQLNPLENTLLTVATNIDSLANFFGGNSNLAGKITNKRIGVLRQSDNWHVVPKLVKIENNKLPANYRDTLSAKAIYHKYYQDDSFVIGKGQKLLHEETVPFGFDDAVKTLDNSYFETKFKITDLDWKLKEYKASLRYWEEIPPNPNLIETYKE